MASIYEPRSFATDPHYEDAPDGPPCSSCNGHGYCPGADMFCEDCEGTGCRLPREIERED